MASDGRNFCNVVVRKGEEKENTSSAEVKLSGPAPCISCECNCCNCRCGPMYEPSSVTPKAREAAKVTTPLKPPSTEPMHRGTADSKPHPTTDFPMHRGKADRKPHPTSDSEALLPYKA